MGWSVTTWNALGLTVGGSYAVLGSLALFQPKLVDALFGVTRPTSDPARRSLMDYHVLSLLIGGRDVALASSILALGYLGRNKEMGAVILSTMFVSVPDIWLVLRNRRYPE